MDWIWDEDKSAANEAKHDLTFETAQLVFDDPLALSRPDPYPFETRWQTVGESNGVFLLVVHTWPDNEDEPGRIISARKATPRERKEYEDGDFS